MHSWDTREWKLNGKNKIKGDGQRFDEQSTPYIRKHPEANYKYYVLRYYNGERLDCPISTKSNKQLPLQSTID